MGKTEGWGGRGNTWQGPTPKQWAQMLAEAAEGPAARRIVKEWGVAYDTFLSWRKRNPERDEEFKTALEARAELYLFDLERLADNLDKDGTPLLVDNGTIQGRNKLGIEYRMSFLKAFNNNFRPKQEVQHSGSIETTQLTDEERAARTLALLDSARTRRDGQSPSESGEPAEEPSDL